MIVRPARLLCLRLELRLGFCLGDQRGMAEGSQQQGTARCPTAGKGVKSDPHKNAQPLNASC